MANEINPQTTPKGDRMPNFLIGVNTINGWQIGYICDVTGRVVRQDRSLSNDQYRAAREGRQFLIDNPAAVQVNCDVVGVRVSHC